MSIRKKALMVVGLTVLILIAALSAASYLLVARRIARLEAGQVETQVHCVLNELKATLDELETIAADWAAWDDTYQFIKDANQSYVEKNLVEATFTDLRLNFMLFFDNQGKLVHSRFFERTPDGLVKDSDALINAIRKQSNPSLLVNSHARNGISGILMAHSRPYLLCSHSIVPRNFGGPARGALIIGRILDADEIGRIGEATKTDLAIDGLNTDVFHLPARRVLDVFHQANRNFAMRVSPGVIAGYDLIPDMNGNPVLILEITRGREVYEYGLATWRQGVASMSLLGLAYIVVLVLVLDHTILNRLKGLARRVGDVRGQSGSPDRLEAHTADEIGQLTESINGMLDSLRQCHSSRMESEDKRLRALQENGHYLRELLDSICCGVMVVDTETHHVVDINAAAATLFQRQRDDIIGHVCHRFVCPNETGKCPVVDMNQTIDMSQRKLLKADKSAQPILKTVKKITHKGRYYLIESFIDISNLKNAEAALRQSEEHYRRFFEEDLTGDILTSLDGRIIECNRALAQILGYDSAEELRGLNLKKFYARESDREIFMDRLQKEKKLERIEVDLLHRDGRPLHCIANLVGRFDRDGRLQEINSYLFDDTKRVQLEKDLRHAHKLEAIGTLAGGIAHDFNNILSGIMGYTEIALNELPPTSLTAEKLQKVMTATHRAKELVQQILTFSRQGESDPHPFKLAPIIKEALKLMRASLPATIEIREKLQMDSTVMADPVQIHQVIMNLCTNAGHAMKQEGGTLTISVVEERLDDRFAERHPELKPGQFVRLSVEDTGEGIPPALMDRIFDPFFTTKSKTEGTGLGLSVVHGIVSNLGGTIAARSTRGGSRFDVYLPRAEKGPQDPMLPSAGIPLGRESIVLIDDEEFQVDVGTQMLESLGYKVNGFTDSLKALEYITANADKVDLVITDMTMPQLTGKSLAGRLLGQLPHLPIIICTGFSEEMTPEKAAAIGIRGFVTKPVLLADLARKVRDILDVSLKERHQRDS